MRVPLTVARQPYKGLFSVKPLRLYSSYSTVLSSSFLCWNSLRYIVPLFHCSLPFSLCFCDVWAWIPIALLNSVMAKRVEQQSCQSSGKVIACRLVCRGDVPGMPGNSLELNTVNGSENSWASKKERPVLLPSVGLKLSSPARKSARSSSAQSRGEERVAGSEQRHARRKLLTSQCYLSAA